MQCLGTLFQVLTKFNSETFPNSCFKALYQRNNDRLFPKNTSAERESKNEMRKQFGVSAGETYQ